MPQPWGGRGETSITAASVTGHHNKGSKSLKTSRMKHRVEVRKVLGVLGPWKAHNESLWEKGVNADENCTLSLASGLLLPPHLFNPVFSFLFSLFFPFPPVPLSFLSSPFPTPILVPYNVRGVKIFSVFCQNIFCIPLLDSNFNYWAGSRPGKECVCVWHTHVCLRAEKGLALAILPEEWDLEGRMLSFSGAKQLRARAWSQVASQEQPNFCFPVTEFGNQRIIKIEIQCLTWSLGWADIPGILIWTCRRLWPTLRICYDSHPSLRFLEEICRVHCSLCQHAVMIKVKLSFCSVLKIVFRCSVYEPRAWCFFLFLALSLDVSLKNIPFNAFLRLHSKAVW